MALFSIRNRLILLAIVVITGFIVQNTLVSNSLDILDQLDGIDDQYKSADSNVIEGLANLDVAIEQYGRYELEQLLIESIFAYDSELGQGINVLAQYNLAVAVVEPLLRNRNTTAYFMDIEEVGLYEYISLNATRFQATDTIMDLGSTGAYGQYLEMKANLQQDLFDVNKDAEQLRSDFRNVSTTYAENAILIGDSNQGILGNITLEVLTVRDRLNASGDKDYAFELMYKINNLYAAINKAISAWAYVQLTGFGVIASDPDFVLDLKTNFHNMLFQSDADYLAAEIAFNDSAVINIDEQISFNKINFVYKNQLSPTLHKIAFGLDDLYDMSLEIDDILEIQVADLLSGFSDYLDDILDTVSDEQFAFKLAFNSIRDDIATEINSSLLLATTITIVLVAVIIIFVGITMVVAFRRLNSKFKEVSEGNLSYPIGSSYANNELGKLESGFDEVVQQLRGALGAISLTSERLSGIAEELGAGSEEASSSVREVSDTMREFAGGASEQNIMLSRINERLEEHLLDVERASSRIGETSSFVLKVAKRTNILGLNASIEAAKAGRFGRGFDVVAKEVRSLSDTTKTSANQIAAIIGDFQDSISRAVEEILREVLIVKEVAENTAAGSEEVSAASMEQVTMLSEISDTSSELASLAQDLNIMIQKFKI